MNIGQIAKMAQQMQAQMAQAQEELRETTLEATAGGGAIRVVITGAAGDPRHRDRSQRGRSRRGRDAAGPDPDRRQRRDRPQQGAGARADGGGGRRHGHCRACPASAARFPACAEAWPD